VGTDSRLGPGVVVSSLLVVGLAFASAGRVEAAGGAYVVEDVDVGAPGSCKVESWVSFASNTDFVGVSNPACVANIGRPVELGVAVARVREEGEWSTAATLKAKTTLIPVEPHKIGLGLMGELTYDVRTGQNTEINLFAPVTFQITEQFRINLNAGWLWDRDGQRHNVTWGAGFEWNFVKPVTLIAEIFARHGGLPVVGIDEPPPRSSIIRPRMQAGLRFTPHEKIDLDVIYGRNINGEDANWITVGLNLRM
jgi:hypothetical protein